MIVNKGKENEVAVRVVLESELYGREYFDYGSLERCMGGVIRLLNDAIDEVGEDGMSRVVGIAVIPRSDYGDESGYYPEFEDGEHCSNVPIADEPATEGIAAMEVLAGLEYRGQPVIQTDCDGSAFLKEQRRQVMTFAWKASDRAIALLFEEKEDRQERQPTLKNGEWKGWVDHWGLSLVEIRTHFAAVASLGDEEAVARLWELLQEVAKSEPEDMLWLAQEAGCTLRTAPATT